VFLLCSPSIHPAPSDYQPGPYSVTFPAGSTTAAVNLTIESDSVLEGTENFTATISTTNTGFPNVTAGDDDTATIDIRDDDPVEVVFNPTQYSVNEGDGVVTLTLNADKPASFEYTVEVETQDGTANGNLGCYITFTYSNTMLSTLDLSCIIA